MANNLVYPWDLSQFTLGAIELASVVYHLNQRGYKTKIEKPDIKVINTINSVVPKLLDNKWIFLFSNSPEFLRILAKILPVVYSLSSMWSVRNVTNADIQTAYINQFDDNNADLAEDMRLCTLLYWENILELHPGLSKNSSIFFDLLNYRLTRKCATILTHVYDGNSLSKSTIRNISMEITRTFRGGVSSIIKEKTEIIDLPMTINNQWHTIGGC